MHGDMVQKERDAIMAEFRNGTSYVGDESLNPSSRLKF
jgi:hypothetical protein